MVVFLQKKNPPMPSDTDFSDESRARIHREMIGAYAGTYSVNGNTVTHHIVAAWRPDWIGQDQVRYVDVQGSVRADHQNGTVALRFDRKAVGGHPNVPEGRVTNLHTATVPQDPHGFDQTVKSGQE
jgi:hypothetical protein